MQFFHTLFNIAHYGNKVNGKISSTNGFFSDDEFFQFFFPFQAKKNLTKAVLRAKFRIG